MTDNQNADWEKTLVPPGATLRNVISALENGAMQIALVVDDGRRLLGTVTDGDVRRALLRGQSMDSNVANVMFTSPMIVGAEIERKIVLGLMQVNKIHQLPIVDDQQCVIGLHVWGEIVSPVQRENTVVIMAGGFGKRMGQHTKNCPKPMLEVSGKPILEHIIERAIAEGFHNFVISLYYLPEVITNYFGDGSKWDCQISYIREMNPLGTAGALSLLAPIPDAPFIVTNGDILTDISYSDMLEFHHANAAAATMAVRQHEWQNPFGVVRTRGVTIIGFEEKPIHRSHVNAGIYVLNPKALNHLERDSICDMPTLFERLSTAGLSTIVYPMHEVWMDVGRPEDLIEANSKVSG